MIEDTTIAFDETNEALIEVKPSFPYERTIPKYPHHHLALPLHCHFLLFVVDSVTLCLSVSSLHVTIGDGERERERRRRYNLRI